MAESSKSFDHFYEIVNAFREATPDANGDIRVDLFLDAMTKFMRVFDALESPLYGDIVKKDVKENIEKVRTAASKHNAETVRDMLDKELGNKELKPLILKEEGIGSSTGTVALLWMKRTMEFVLGLIRGLVEDASVTLATASRASYSKTLRYCHSFIVRNVFDTGLRFAPAREVFIRNLSGSSADAKVDEAFKEFSTVGDVVLKNIVDTYYARELETCVPKA